MNYAELPLTVLKFGGTSVAGPERMRHVAQIVKKVRDSGYRVAVVVSAMGNMTDDLLALAKDVANTAERGSACPRTAEVWARGAVVHRASGGYKS